MRQYLSVSHSLTRFREEVKPLPPEKQRYQYYTSKVATKGLNEIYIDKFDDGVVRYVRNEYRLLFNNKCFLKPTKTEGFRFDGKRQIKTWGNQSLAMADSKLYTILELDWMEKEGFVGGGWVTPGLLARALAGKVTNPSEACKYLIGAYRYPKTTSPEFLRQYIKKESKKTTLMSAASAVTDINDLLSDKIVLDHSVRDLIRQAHILGRKVNLKWSEKRVEAEHAAWTKELMDLEVDMVEDIELPYGPTDFLPPHVKLIRTKRELYAEGTLMKHCVYTNYWDRIMDGKYAILHVDDPVDPYTIGINIHTVFKDNIRGVQCDIDQARTRGNLKDKDEEAEELINTFRYSLCGALSPAREKLTCDYDINLPF